MKKTILALTLALAAIGCAPPAAQHKVGLNLGKQLSAITLAAGNNNDVAIAGTSNNTTTVIKFTPNSAGSTITGMASSTISDSDLFVLRNESATASITITNADTGSLAANRFATAGALPLVLLPKSSAIVYYDATAALWQATLTASAAPNLAGHVTSNSTAIPVLSTCGTSPTIVAGSTDTAGKITTGGTATTCTITFAATWGTAPSCVLTPEGSATQPTYTTSATAITASVDIASTVYNYVCVGR